MKATIRSATPADIPHVLRLIRGLAEYEHMLDQVTLTEADLRDALFGPRPRVSAIVAQDDGPPMGLALFYHTFNTFRARSNIFLEDLFVEAEYRGQGIGLALMRHLAQVAIAQNCGRIEWRVLNWNQPSIDFYKRIGAVQALDWQTRQLGGARLAALAEGKSHG
jgi:GNAT superfamily N-acetyltransferase